MQGFRGWRLGSILAIAIEPRGQLAGLRGDHDFKISRRILDKGQQRAGAFGAAVLDQVLQQLNAALIQLRLRESAGLAGGLSHLGVREFDYPAKDRLSLLLGDCGRYDLRQEVGGIGGRPRCARKIENPAHAGFRSAGRGHHASQQRFHLIGAVHADVIMKKPVGLGSHIGENLVLPGESIALPDGSESVLRLVPEFGRHAAGVLLAPERFERQLRLRDGVILFALLP